MMALRAHARGGPEQLVYESAPRPSPGPGEALVRVHAAAITFAELGWDETWTRQDGSDRTPIIPGHEVSGVVEEAGPGCALAVGDEVYGLIDFDRDGAAAQYVTVPGDVLARKPAGATHEQAAAMALSALTAWQALVDQAGIEQGERVLIIGAPGGVGVYAVQLARARGAEVTGTGRESGRELVTRLGAQRFLDYTAGPLDPGASGFDVVLDAAGAGDDESFYRALRPGGRMILLAGPPDADRAKKHEVHATFFIVTPDGAELAALAALVDKGELEPVVGQRYPLAEGRTAFESGSRPRPPGKTVLLVG
ncbi:zinc-binding dehydrogenase [Actinospica robiniae]|uniref:zinc-binding dehydrogenase n=1 Tax=Actinospica robiniae TaxID=304901 RepID=UPI000554D4F2